MSMMIILVSQARLDSCCILWLESDSVRAVTINREGEGIVAINLTRQ